MECIQCGGSLNGYQCSDSNSGKPVECASGINYCQKATSNGLTFRQCGELDFGTLPGMSGFETIPDMCVKDVVSKIKIKNIGRNPIVDCERKRKQK